MAQPFKKLAPSYSIGLDDLAEAVQLNPSLPDDPLFQQITAQVEAKILAEFWVPTSLFGPDDCSYSNFNASNHPTLPTSMNELMAGMLRAKSKMDTINETAKIADRLPAFLKTNRWELAKHLWVAGRVFEHNLSTMAKLHGLLRR